MEGRWLSIASWLLISSPTFTLEIIRRFVPPLTNHPPLREQEQAGNIQELSHVPVSNSRSRTDLHAIRDQVLPEADNRTKELIGPLLNYLCALSPRKCMEGRFSEDVEWRFAMKMKPVLVMMLLLLVVSLAPAEALSPMERLTYTKTTGLAAGAHTFRLSLWNVANGGDPAFNEVWAEEKSVNLPASGKLTTQLGTAVPIDAPMFYEQLWVQVEVQNPDLSYSVIGSRVRLQMVPYALHAISSETGGSVSSVNPGSGLISFGSTGDVILGADFLSPGGEAGADIRVARSDHHHNSRYPTKQLLRKLGTINRTTNPVDWSNLKNVPAGFADGTDDGAQYTAGTGLSLLGSEFTLDARHADGSAYDGRFVNVAGDTLSGKLNLPNDGLSVGTNQFVVSGGWAGFGTLAPAYHVEVSSATDTQLALRSTAPQGRVWSIQSSGTGGPTLEGTFQIIDRSAGAARLLVSPSGEVSIPGRLKLNSVLANGSVGIGMDPPQYPLDVNGRIRSNGVSPFDGGLWLANGNVNRGFVGLQDNEHLGFFGEGGAGWALRVNRATGNVGVGPNLANTTAKLEVSSNGSTGNPQILVTQTTSEFARVRFRNGRSFTNNRYWDLAAFIAPTPADDRFHIFNSAGGDVFGLTGNGAISVNNSLGQPQQVMTSAGSGGAASWQPLGSLIKTAYVMSDVPVGLEHFVNSAAERTFAKNIVIDVPRPSRLVISAKFAINNACPILGSCRNISDFYFKVDGAVMDHSLYASPLVDSATSGTVDIANYFWDVAAGSHMITFHTSKYLGGGTDYSASLIYASVIALPLE